MAPVTTRAVLLRAHAYGETSRILRFYSADQGLLGIMAKGIRGQSGKRGGGLASFASGDLTAYVRVHRELHTMKDFHCTHPRRAMGSHPLRFAGGAAVAEMVLSHTEQESNPELFAALEAALDVLNDSPADDLATACLAGLWHVVGALGFTPQLEGCVVCARTIEGEGIGRFDLAAGGMRCTQCGEGAAGPRVGPGARRQIERLLRGEQHPPITHARRHLALLADFVAYHVASKPMKSLDFLAGMLPDDEV